MNFELKKHPHFRGGIQCRINFDNGNGIDIITGVGSYTDNNTYEIAPLKNDELFWVENWGDQVRGYVTVKEVSEIVEYAASHTQQEYYDFLNNFQFGRKPQTLDDLLDSCLEALSSCESE